MHYHRTVRVLLVLLGLAACGHDASLPRAQAPCDPPMPTLRAFRHTWSGRGAPRHAVNDVVVPVGQPYAIRAKLAYGPTSKDLEDEEVVLFTAEGSCGPWVEQAAVTDDDGWVRYDLPPVTTAAVRPFHVVVAGDGTRVTGSIYAVAPATTAVVFDVDGTLTTGDPELVKDLLGHDAAAMRDGAPAVAQRWAELGHMIVYLTGRPYYLRASTQAWLAARGFPGGPLFTVERSRDAIPVRDRVGAFKRDRLAALIGAGVVFEAAYGNAATDVCAYADAGIDPARTWMTQPRDGCDGRPAPNLLSGYVEHLPELPTR
jgi:hypothetical protein